MCLTICQEAGSSNPNIRILYHHHPHILRFVRFVSAWPEALAALRNRPPVNIDLVIWMLKDVFTNCNKENYIFFTGSEKTAAVWSSLSLFFFTFSPEFLPRQNRYTINIVCASSLIWHIFTVSAALMWVKGKSGEAVWRATNSFTQEDCLWRAYVRLLTQHTYLTSCT